MYDKKFVITQDKKSPLRHDICHAISGVMDKPFSDIASRIKWHRALLDMTQADYAGKAGLKRAQLNNWESGDYRVSIDGARALRHTYGLSLDFIYEGISDAGPMSLRNAWLDKPAESASR